jgi:hypothetical protein
MGGRFLYLVAAGVVVACLSGCSGASSIPTPPSITHMSPTDNTPKIPFAVAKVSR